MRTDRAARRQRPPGTVLIGVGLGLAIFGALILVLTALAGFQTRHYAWIVIGLVIAAIGFCRRVLAALEKR